MACSAASASADFPASESARPICKRKESDPLPGKEFRSQADTALIRPSRNQLLRSEAVQATAFCGAPLVAKSVRVNDAECPSGTAIKAVARRAAGALSPRREALADCRFATNCVGN